MNRRSFLGTLAMSHTAAASQSSAKPPDMLLFIADDHSWVDTGCYGARHVATPNIDRTAAEGVRFTHAFTATAMCAPMRQQMMTGLFPVRNGAYPNHSHIKPGIKTWPSYFRDLGYRVGLAGKRHFGPIESYPYEFVGDAEGDPDYKAIDAFIRRDPTQPYCLLVTSHEPHGPHDKGDPSRHPVSNLKVPSYWVDTPDTRETLSKYYAEVEYVDQQFGRCRDLVDRSTQASNTLLMYCSEQGIGMPFGKWTCYDLGLRQALAVRWPGRIKPRTVSGAMIQGVDWLPTLLQAAGGQAPSDIDGRSFLPALLGQTDHHADAVFGVHTTRGIINGSPCYPIRSVRTRTHKLILNLQHETKFQCVLQGPDSDFWPSWVAKAKTGAAARSLVERYEHRPPVEYYDVTRDPFEQNNLAGRPEHKPNIDALTKQLHDWMRQQGDLGVATEMLIKPHRNAAAA